MRNNLRITIAQVNTILGDINGNADKIISASLRARDQQQADLVVFPESVVTGYPTEDLLFRTELHRQIKIAIKKIQTKVRNIRIILGVPIKEHNKLFNAAILIYNGKILARYHKQCLPNTGVFDEKRYFTAGTECCVVNIKEVKVALTVCEDMWNKAPVLAAKKARAQLIISINASPFDLQKHRLREYVLKNRALESKMPIVYVNSIGGQDELIFDGGSLVMDSSGKVTQRAPFFVECLMPVDLIIDTKIEPINGDIAPIPTTEELVYQALVLGVRDYVEKNNFQKVIISVSGGIDSALTLAIAVDALGKDRVETLYLPSKHSSTLSRKIVREEAKSLGVVLDEISIEPLIKACSSMLSLSGSTAENIQARCRAVILMAFSNKKNLLVLSTGNKSEVAVGYTTLYGDMAGGLCVLKDISKTLVYALAKYRNSISLVIPEAAITREPTAELSKNQKDSDNLPPYNILDKILERYIEQEESIDKITAAGFNHSTVIKVVNMIKQSEHKRRQAPPGIKVTVHAFGRDRRYPITSRFNG